MLCYVVMLWDHRPLCRPSLTKTLLCGTWLYFIPCHILNRVGMNCLINKNGAEVRHITRDWRYLCLLTWAVFIRTWSLSVSMHTTTENNVWTLLPSHDLHVSYACRFWQWQQWRCRQWCEHITALGKAAFTHQQHLSKDNNGLLLLLFISATWHLGRVQQPQQACHSSPPTSAAASAWRLQQFQQRGQQEKFWLSSLPETLPSSACLWPCCSFGVRLPWCVWCCSWSCLQVEEPQCEQVSAGCRRCPLSRFVCFSLY